MSIFLASPNFQARSLPTLGNPQPLVQNRKPFSWTTIRGLHHCIVTAFGTWNTTRNVSTVLYINDTWWKHVYFKAIIFFEFEEDNRGFTKLMIFVNLFCVVVLKILRRIAEGRSNMALQGCAFCACYRTLLFIRRARQIAKHISYAAYRTATDANVLKSVCISNFDTTVHVSSSYVCVVRYWID